MKPLTCHVDVVPQYKYVSVLEVITHFTPIRRIRSSTRRTIIMSQLPGGFSDTKAADEEIQKICGEVSLLFFFSTFV